MPVTVQCPDTDCGAAWTVSDADRGRPGRCPHCGREVSLFATRYPEAQPADDPSPASTTPRSSELAAGATFGRYRILRPLGHGGMGAVYLAHDTQLDRQVALKVPHFGPADGPQVIDRFYAEARAAATFDHPNLCPVYDVGQLDAMIRAMLREAGGGGGMGTPADGVISGRATVGLNDS
jgi:hypothetical protein